MGQKGVHVSECDSVYVSFRQSGIYVGSVCKWLENSKHSNLQRVCVYIVAFGLYFANAVMRT